LAGYLETLAQRCAAAGPCVIGHIKGLAALPSGGYLRLSVLAPDCPAEVDLVEIDPQDCILRLVLTINVIVYGLAADSVKQLIWAAAAEIGSAQGAAVSVAPATLENTA
jgi:hypothetical protein